MAKRIFFLLFLFSGLFTQAQVMKDSLPQREFNPYRFAGVVGAGTAFYGGTLASLYSVWYQDNHRTGFHWTNDNAGWLQIDKYGHAYTSYMFGKLGMQSLRWAGVKDKKAIIYGGSFGFLFLTSVEILDAHYEEWGASPMDMVANASGGLLLVGQELAFKKQVVTFKFSYHHTNLAQYRPGVLGETDFERLVEDYNGQTFWLSTNIRSVLPNQTWIPSWLNVAPGYGAYGMLAGEENPIYASDGSPLPPIFRQRNYYLSLDIDWDKIPTESRFLKSVFFFLNFIKFPLPTYEVNSFGESKVHAFYF